METFVVGTRCYGNWIASHLHLITLSCRGTQGKRRTNASHFSRDIPSSYIYQTTIALLSSPDEMNASLQKKKQLGTSSCSS